MNIFERTTNKYKALSIAELIVRNEVIQDTDYLDIISKVDLAITNIVDGVDKVSVLDKSAQLYRELVDEHSSQ